MDVNNVVNELASKFHTTTIFLIDEMRKYYIINYIMWVLFSIIVITLFIIFGRVLIKKSKNMKEEDVMSDYELPMTFGYVSTGIGFIFVIVLFNTITNLLQWYITPTASVINEIVTKLGR